MQFLVIAALISNCSHKDTSRYEKWSYSEWKGIIFALLLWKDLTVRLLRLRLTIEVNHRLVQNLSAGGFETSGAALKPEDLALVPCSALWPWANLPVSAFLCHPQSGHNKMCVTGMLRLLLVFFNKKHEVFPEMKGLPYKMGLFFYIRIT